MDWMGGRLAQLIEEGKRALGKEVVVMSEAAEDAEDDMSGNWEEDEEDDAMTHSRPASRRGSMRRKHRPQNLGAVGPSSSPYGLGAAHSTPHLAQFAPLGALPISAQHTRAGSEELRTSQSFAEDPASWQSAEMRESMERARARLLASRR
jgi:hypothetical protein